MTMFFFILFLVADIPAVCFRLTLRIIAQAAAEHKISAWPGGEDIPGTLLGFR